MASDFCKYCEGARFVGWSRAGPILCPRCSEGKDVFTVITQAWREQCKAARELASENAVLRSKIASMQRRIENLIARIDCAITEVDGR